MIETIGRRTALKKYPALPAANWRTGAYKQAPVFNNYILSAAKRTGADHLTQVINGLHSLLVAINCDRFISMGDTSTPWLLRTTKGGSAKAATLFLKSLGVKTNFTGGFIVTLNDLDNFIQHMFLLMEINAVPFDIHFVDDKESIICHPCKYGNLHFSTLTQDTDRIYKKQ